MTDLINWDATKEDAALIRKIVARAIDEADEDLSGQRLDFEMSLTAYHLNDRPLRLQAMLDGHLFDLLHDLHGIHNTVSRMTGKVVGLFLPRYAEKRTEAT